MAKVEKDIQMFECPEFGKLRTLVDEKGIIMFIARDVAKGLGFSDATHLTRMLDDDEKGLQIVETLGGKQAMTVITESGFYHAALKSRVERAKAFRKWVTSVVLPQIRRTGGYIPIDGSNGSSAEEILAKALLIAKRTIDEQSRLIEVQTPKAEYAEKVLMSPTCYTMTQVAKGLSMTVLELTRRLLEMQIIYRSPSGPYMLYSDFLKKGLEAYRTKTGTNLFGDVEWTDTYLVWTEKGREFICGQITNS